MNSTVLDYVDQTSRTTEAWMAERYGEDWQNTKFDYRGDTIYNLSEMSVIGSLLSVARKPSSKSLLLKPEHF